MPHSCFFSILPGGTRSTFYRANIARQLAELAATLAEMEAEAARNFTENSSSSAAA